jgi:hypothetical protein
MSSTVIGAGTSTITKPNVKSIIRAIATILHSQMTEDQSSGKELNTNSDLYFFSEEKYIQKNLKNLTNREEPCFEQCQQ